MRREKNISDISEGVIRTYYQPLAAFIRSRVGMVEDAEDILQEVWLQYSSRDAEDRLRSESGWLYRVARNKIIDYYRRISPEWLEDWLLEGGEEWEEEESTETVDLQLFWEEFYEVLNSMPPNQREVFVLNELEGITLREIAEERGEKLKTIISRKGYAVKRLRERLGEIFGDFLLD